MEKNTKSLKPINPIKIIITGPESTGKSTLAKQLAKEYSGIYIPEYARQYIENLSRPYSYFDLIEIAKKQMQELEQKIPPTVPAIFYDTGPEITKIWFEEVYQSVPDFLENYIKKIPADFFLLCKTDLSWKKDKVRENNGKKREYLFERYKDILEENRFPYALVEGFEKKRIASAIKQLASAHHLQNHNRNSVFSL